MRLGAGMAGITEILMMTSFTGILILLNIYFMRVNPFGIKGYWRSRSQRNMTDTAFIRRRLAIMAFTAGLHGGSVLVFCSGAMDYSTVTLNTAYVSFPMVFVSYL
jgi:hypothetical protein